MTDTRNVGSKRAGDVWRLLAYVVEAYSQGDSFRSPREWAEVLDETLSDLCRARGVEPKRTLVDTLEDSVA